MSEVVVVPREPTKAEIDAVFDILDSGELGEDFSAADVCRAMISAAPPPLGGWRPIETAPKDGTSILAICATAYSPVAGVTWWQDGWTHYSRPAEKWHGGVGKWFPTHWMPLPSPPQPHTKDTP